MTEESGAIGREHPNVRILRHARIGTFVWKMYATWPITLAVSLKSRRIKGNVARLSEHIKYADSIRTFSKTKKTFGPNFELTT